MCVIHFQFHVCTCRTVIYKDVKERKVIDESSRVHQYISAMTTPSSRSTRRRGRSDTTRLMDVNLDQLLDDTLSPVKRLLPR